MIMTVFKGDSGQLNEAPDNPVEDVIEQVEQEQGFVTAELARAALNDPRNIRVSRRDSPGNVRIRNRARVKARRNMLPRAGTCRRKNQHK